MLIDFSMQNYKSFKAETVLSAEAGERLRKFQATHTVVMNGKRLLKNLLIFGPNGSGKSNLLAGLKQMQTIVLNDPGKVTDLLAADRFVLAPETQLSDTTFSVTFSVGQRIYGYQFSYNAKQISYECLTITEKRRPKVYFERSAQGFKTSVPALNEVAKRTKKNSLVLYTAMQNNDCVATEVFTWFAEDLLFVGDYQPTPVVSELVGLAKNEQVKNQLLNFLHFADFNIVDLEVNEQPTMPDSHLAAFSANPSYPSYSSYQMMNKLFAVHKVYDEAGNMIGTKSLAMESESRGTQKILMIALAFINAELNGNHKTLLFDEFDDSLHLELSQAMIRIFNSAASQNQFILTTHELQLLDSELRTDQIYLVEKDFKGESQLTSLFDFKDTRHTTRGGISYMKRYVEGRFGATPIIEPDKMLDALIDTEQNMTKLSGH
ncbi:AAA family ATPase [Lactiplantibacillus pentosus]|uniref:ATP-binding protein n=1 Tax=Lactiplantibacillus pentosus TaxID=1589 RepID=A0AAW8VVF5_LACPE|nr:ATP-binding protein [Lactiplantibacillus pentosus]MBU7473903.1 ATP-binding protein [Lactiplantibacillus pentosus]MBU7529065.1 ATP-binding protein [Lactiplantibacillus pentosus]MCT3304835.1 ATP-binding protein [Lactiplantibacillus pentosus]MDT6989253.1 ATP-binding protein [Lactiplantibacillus pentosus]